FRIVSGFVVGGELFSSQTVFSSAESFFYVFFGSIFVGVALGYFASVLLQKIRTEQILISAVITALALGSFSTAEHFLHVSGVMTTVIAGVVFGNLARGKIKSSVTHFVEEYFEYIGFIALSLVFFFASFTLDLGLFTSELPMLFIVVVVVLFARAVSVYGTVFISNHVPGFRDEPNIPLSWQHILNWGGLRGVIPLVLVYSLPDSFVYKELLLQFTFATLLFTLFVNGLTIKSLLMRLRLHIPAKEERIVQDEMKLFAIEEAQKKLHSLNFREFTPSVLRSFDDKLFSEENKYKRELLTLSKKEELIKSVKLQSIAIERKTLRKLFEQGRFSEGVLYEFESELDLQEDILEYPHMYDIRGVNSVGDIVTRKSFRKRLSIWKKFIVRYKWLSRILNISEKDIVSERYSLLRARLFTSYAVLNYIDRVEKLFHHNQKMVKAIVAVREVQQRYIKKNQKENQHLSIDYPNLIISYQKNIVEKLIAWK
ncbi:MAG TPA: cation:proton antiporter, partial [Patescibacteria group bacterium]|nr:cation:proton antiporter [Patescibacteria group bacterium]